jgi:hypothetical protein
MLNLSKSNKAVKIKALQMKCFCDPDWIRTNDPQLRRLMLYPAELPNLDFWVANIGQKNV